MKNRLFIAIALWVLLASFDAPKKEVETVLSGVLPDLKNESIRLVPIQDYFPGLQMPGSYPTVQTDSLGRYTFRFATAGAHFYQVVKSNYHQLNADVYLEPGDSIFIDQSSWNDDPKFVITGKGSEKLKHLEKDYAILPKDVAFYDKTRSKDFPSELDFKRFIDSIHLARVRALSSSKDVPEILKAYHANTLKAERAKFLLEHLERRNYYMKESFDYFYPEAGYLSFLDSINFDNEFSQTTAARLFSNTYLDHVARKAFQSKTEEQWWEDNLGYKLEYVAAQPKCLWTDLLALGTIREYSMGLMANDFFTDLNKFNASVSNKFFSSQNQILFEANASAYQLLAPGKPAPDFALPDSSGKMNRLSDYKGRIVYIDFWGTWCMPCIQEIPEALKLQEKYKGQPVTFLYVALEYDSTNIAGWKEFIAGKNARFGKVLNNNPFPGVHVVAEKQFRNERISAYKLNFAPTYVLVDQHGKIVKARADRPKEIQDDIDALLKTIKTE